MNYKILDTTDNKREGGYISLPDAVLFEGSKIPMDEMIFEISRIVRDGPYLILHSSNYSVILKAVGNG